MDEVFGDNVRAAALIEIVPIAHFAGPEHHLAIAIEQRYHDFVRGTGFGRGGEAMSEAAAGSRLDENAVAALRGASFTPATRCGVPAPSTFTVAVRFTL